MCPGTFGGTRALYPVRQRAADAISAALYFSSVYRFTQTQDFTILSQRNARAVHTMAQELTPQVVRAERIGIVDACVSLERIRPKARLVVRARLKLMRRMRPRDSQTHLAFGESCLCRMASHDDAISSLRRSVTGL